MRQSLRKKPFTLIELLTVMAIASILLAIMAPAFNRMLFGDKVDQCASGLKLGMELAQAKAVASRKYIALVLPGRYDDVTDKKLQPYVGGGYRCAYVKKEGSSWEFISWVPDESWRNPADGAMLVRVTDSKSSAVVDESRETGAHFSHLVSLSGSDDDLTALQNPPALIFSPYGGLANDSTTTLYFVVTEASVEGGKYRYHNTDDTLILKLNPVTGQVGYYEE